MANIIALCGKSNTGKTTVLGEVIYDIISSGNIPINLVPCGERDQVVTFTINHKKVGITTRGDMQKYLRDDFKKMGDCDVYVCACHTYGGTQDFLNDREKDKKDSVIFFHTWEEVDKTEQHKRNSKKKQEICESIQYFC